MTPAPAPAASSAGKRTSAARRVSAPATDAAAVPGVAVDPPPTETLGPALGRAARRTVPRSTLAAWVPGPDRRDPVDVLVEQAASRVPELVPLRYARMLVSPFTFYRGAAAVMAGDLAATPHSGLQVQLCGDAHLANFGGFAAPDRTMVFDLNDFDETVPGPFEWDLKRLVASFAVAARDRQFTPELRSTLTHDVVRSYRDAMVSFAALPRLAVWYERLNAESIRQRWGATIGDKGLSRFERNLAKARAKTSSKAFSRYTERDADGQLRIVSQPPVLVPLEHILDGDVLAQAHKQVHAILDAYRSTLLPDRRWLLAGYRVVAVARKVVGVGSVGTRCWVVLLVALDDDQDDLVLQIKEAGPSVLDGFLATNTYASQGERVVAGQRVLQAAGDVLLGWTRIEGIDAVERDFYVRQLWDWKTSADLATLDPTRFTIYAQMCGWTLARAHARSGDRKAIAAYLGTSDTAVHALAQFAEAYADQNERDYALLRAAAADGRVPVAASTEG